jgi:hypothetical protein
MAVTASRRLGLLGGWWGNVDISAVSTVEFGTAVGAIDLTSPSTSLTLPLHLTPTDARSRYPRAVGTRSDDAQNGAVVETPLYPLVAAPS